MGPDFRWETDEMDELIANELGNLPQVESGSVMIKLMTPSSDEESSSPDSIPSLDLSSIKRCPNAKIVPAASELRSQVDSGDSDGESEPITPANTITWDYPGGPGYCRVRDPVARLVSVPVSGRG